MSSKVKRILTATVVVIGLALAFYLGRKSVHIPDAHKSIDTMFVEKPIVKEVKVVEQVHVPIYVKVASTPDTVYVAKTDSVLVRVPVRIERQEYKDSLLRAVVSGPSIGDFHPKLEEYEVYAISETRIVEKPTPFIRPYLTVSGGEHLIGGGFGLCFKQKLDVGARYLHIQGKGYLALEAGWRF